MRPNTGSLHTLQLVNYGHHHHTTDHQLAKADGNSCDDDDGNPQVVLGLQCIHPNTSKCALSETLYYMVYMFRNGMGRMD